MTCQHFFKHCLSYDGIRLQAVEQAVRHEDWEKAEKEFGIFLRNYLSPRLAFYKPLPLFVAPIALEGETWKDVADRILNQDIVSCYIRYQFEGEIDWDYNPTPDHFREWTWQFNRHNEFRYLAQAYRETGDERYTKQYLKMILSWIEQEPVPENEPGGATDCWRTIETGLRMSGNWYEALHTFAASPIVSDHDLVTIVASFWENGWRLRHFNTCGNWLFMEMAGLTYVGQLFPFFKEAEEWSRYALQRLDGALAEQLYPEGFQYELTLGYHNVVLMNALSILELYQFLGKTYPKEIAAKIHKMSEIFVKYAMPNGNLPDLNDGNPNSVKKMLEEPAKIFSEDEIFCFFTTDGKEGKLPTYTSVQLPNVGIAIMRTDWTRDAVWCLLEAAPFGFGHQHEDKLEVLFQAYGSSFLTEAGTNAYDDSPLHRYSLSSFGHNTVLVDGCGQNRRARYSRKDLRTDVSAGMYWRSNDIFDAAQGVYNEGYGENLLPVVHTRRVLFVKQSETGFPFVLIIDRLENTDQQPHQYQAVWHMEDLPITLEKTQAYICAMNGASLVWQVAGADKIDLVKGQTTPVFQGWKASWKEEEKNPLPTVIAKRRSAGPVRMVTLLYPLPAGEKKPDIQLIAGEKQEDTLIRLLVQEKEIVLDESCYFVKSE